MKEHDIISLTLQKLSLGVHGSSGSAGDCPDDETFGAFIDGELEEGAAKRFCDHVTSCPHCHTTLAALKETEGIDGPPVPARLTASAKDLVSPPLGALVSAPLARLALKLLDGALAIVDLAGIEVVGGLDHAAQPVRSGSSTTAENAAQAGVSPAERAEILELAPSVPAVKRIIMQKIDPDDVKISIQPKNEQIARTGYTFRLELLRGDTLLQSWPLESGLLSLEPVTTGRYSLEILEIPSAGGGRPERICTIDINLQC